MRHFQITLTPQGCGKRFDPWWLDTAIIMLIQVEFIDAGYGFYPRFTSRRHVVFLGGACRSFLPPSSQSSAGVPKSSVTRPWDAIASAANTLGLVQCG